MNLLSGNNNNLSTNWNINTQTNFLNNHLSRNFANAFKLVKKLNNALFQ